MDDPRTLIQSEAEARVEVALIKKKLASLETLIGPDGQPDIVEMASRLQAELDRQKVLEAQLAAQEAVSIPASDGPHAQLG